MSNYTITVARSFGSGGKTVGKLLAERLDINYYNDDLIKLASEESGINLELFGKADEKVKTNLFKKYNKSYGEKVLPPDSGDFVSEDNLFNYQAKIIRELASKQSNVIIGRCANYVLKDQPNTVRLFVYADEETCIKNIIDVYGISPEDAAKKKEAIDKQRAAYYRYYTGKNWDDTTSYDLCINTSGMSFEKVADILVGYLKNLGVID